MLEHGFYNMDCMDGMRTFPDKYFDLAIIDPPYGIGEDGSNNHTRGKLATAKDYKPFYGGDKRPPDREYFRELERVSKNRIIFGANHFIEKIPYNSRRNTKPERNGEQNDKRKGGRNLDYITRRKRKNIRSNPHGNRSTRSRQTERRVAESN